jgi:hypothetical protein
MGSRSEAGDSQASHFTAETAHSGGAYNQPFNSHQKRPEPIKETPLHFHRRLALPAAIFALACAAPAVHADATSEARKAIAAAYAKMDKAAESKNAAGILALHSPDFSQTSKSGQKRTYAELKQMVPQMMKVAKTVKTKTVIEKFALKGNSAIVNNKDHTEILFVNPRNAEQTMKVVVDSTNEDTWTKSSKGWLKKHSKNLTSNQTMNGQPMQQQP